MRDLQNDAYVIKLGDLNGRVGGNERDKIVGKWRVEGRNENGEYLVGLCAERNMFLCEHLLRTQIYPQAYMENSGRYREGTTCQPGSTLQLGSTGTT